MGGVALHSWSLDVDYPQADLNRPMSIGLGSVSHESETWPTSGIGNVQAFRGVLTVEQCTVLAAMGVRCRSVVESVERATYPSMANYARQQANGRIRAHIVLAALQVWAVVQESKNLQRRLLLVHSSFSPTTFGVYVMEHTATANRPLEHPVEWRARPLIVRDTHLLDVVNTLGALPMLVYIYANVGFSGKFV